MNTPVLLNWMSACGWLFGRYVLDLSYGEASAVVFVTVVAVTYYFDARRWVIRRRIRRQYHRQEK